MALVGARHYEISRENFPSKKIPGMKISWRFPQSPNPLPAARRTLPSWAAGADLHVVLQHGPDGVVGAQAASPLARGQPALARVTLLRRLVAEAMVGPGVGDPAGATDDDDLASALPDVPGAVDRRELLLPPLFGLARAMAEWPDARPDGRLTHAVFSGVPRGLPPRESDVSRELRRFERIVAHIHGDDEAGAAALARRWSRDITRAAAGVRPPGGGPG